MHILDRFLKPCPVTFHEADHTYTLNANGKLIPGVTSITHNLNKPELNGWYAREAVGFLKDRQDAIKEATPKEYEALLKEAADTANRKKDEAADSGTTAHDWIEQYVNEKMGGAGPLSGPAMPEDGKAVCAIRAFLEWEKERDVKWLASELVVGSEKHEFGGKLDGIAAVNGIPTLIDFKTSNGVRKEYFLQTAAYSLAIQEMGLEVWERMILRIPKDGAKFEWYRVPTPYDLDRNAFLSLRYVQKWQSYLSNPDNGILDGRGFIIVNQNKNIVRI